MTTKDATWKETRRAAYATYVDCFWALRRLPLDAAKRPALALATQQAEVAWRALMTQALARDHVMCDQRSAAQGNAR